MDRFTSELSQIHNELETAVANGEAPEVTRTLDCLQESAERVGLAWSGSWLGYQANVYYADLKPPPTGEYFDKEWGLRKRYNRDCRWTIFDPAQVNQTINEGVDQSTRALIGDIVATCVRLFDDHKHNVISILHSFGQDREDSFIEALIVQIEEISAISRNQHLQPPETMSRDSVAVQQGFWTPPHIENLIQLDRIRRSISRTKKLMKIVERAIAHLGRTGSGISGSRRAAERIFIGHGRSHLWRALKDFLQDRMYLECDEFNRVSTAGIPISDRLDEMLQEASFAFLILTAEDETADGKVQARMNVIHEAGLFQGRLGFKKAILILQEGCEEFSNIHGLGQLRFHGENIKETFEEIRQLLEERHNIAT